MNTFFLSRLAWNNIKKNARLYVPNILTGIGLTAVFYIMLTLAMDNRLSEVRGGRYLPSIMPYGVAIIAILSCILIPYTNSFLMKQRNREFGLYNVLGLEKRHIGRILFAETVISFLVVLIAGLVAGIILYKLCALFICRILAVNSVLGFYHISHRTLIPTAVFLTALYLAIWFFNLIRIARMNPVELLQSTHTGEKEPRIKWFLLIIGLAALACGYFISITLEQPLKDYRLTFAAIILVILGTYCLFVTGSIALLKLLKSRTHFYYHHKHMIAVAGLLYRMKQNAVGLASITVLATMVLVMVSTTVSMYAGIGDSIRRDYPHQIYMKASYNAGEKNVNVPMEELLDMVNTAAAENNLTISYTGRQRYFICAFSQSETELLTDLHASAAPVMCWFITAKDYQNLTGKSLHLAENQLAVYGLPDNSVSMPDAVLIGNKHFTCSALPDNYPVSMDGYRNEDCLGFVVSDESVFESIYEFQKRAYPEQDSEIIDNLVIDFTDEDAVSEAHDQLFANISMQMQQYIESRPDSTGGYGMSVDSKWDTMEYLYGMNGTLLFLGLMLSIVFLFATALIIYYKQISEGYEDRDRFQIMQKVGMSADEVQGSIRSQILLVFFLPLIAAAVHVAFAFPMLTRLLKILFQPNQILFMGCSIGTLLIFAVIYVLIYSVTARIYYQIVR